MRADAGELEARLNYRFQAPELLRRALTHSSLANELRTTGAEMADNEQLEFLGDSVLGFLVTEALVRRSPAAREGELSRQKSHLVSAAYLHGVARRLDLGSFLHLARCEEIDGGRSKKTLLVDALEAVIAAIFLDGGIEAARRFVTTHLLEAENENEADSPEEIKPAVTNYKDALRDLVRARNLPQPKYILVREEGPGHNKIFTMEVRVGKNVSSRAEGRTKKIAAQRAARVVYEGLLGSAEAVAPEEATPVNAAEESLN